ncbi:MAG TPA: serine--tRNA ligase [Kineosporiaceae bacterium]|nr:serine--tRNA ligase [Kineosporiaceae bacterium]
MLDPNEIRRDPERISKLLAKRQLNVDFGPFLATDAELRKNQTELEQARAERKSVSEQIAKLRRSGEDDSALRERSQAIGDRITELEADNRRLSTERQSFLDGLPNLPDEDVPPGGKESNVVIREFGQAPAFDFTPRDHVELAESLGLVDYKRGTKLNGTGSWVYTGLGAQLEWALLNYFVQSHLRDGYTFILPPHILTYEGGYAAGQFPKFAEDVYIVERDEDGTPSHFLIPTAETALVSLHRDEIIPAEDLPLKYFAYTPCYRKEIGGYRSYERGTLRGHQFDKVEMFQYTTPEDSARAHEELVGKAEALVQGLELHHRVTLLAAEDTSASMAKTFDIEVLLPSIDRYLEVSSSSNARDFQARRGRIRFRGPDGKPQLVHTLNASGLATSRLLPAILEQHQQADGSVRMPEVLRPWMPERLMPKG